MVTIADNVSTDQNVQQLMNVVDRIFTERFYDIKFGIEVHTLVFNYCISRSAQDTENALFVKTSGRRKYLLGITINKGTCRTGAEIYFLVENYLITHVNKLYELMKDHSEKDLLPIYVKKWREYYQSSDTANRLFNYLNQHWIRRAIDCGYRSIYQIFTLCMLIWRELLWKRLNDKLTIACSNLIKTWRSKPIDEIQLIADVIHSYKTIEFNEDMFIWISNCQTRVLEEKIYENYFEKQFLQDSQDFYRSRIAFDFQNDSILNYLKQITSYIENDIQSIYPHLQSSTQVKMLELISKIFFEDHLNMICDELYKSIENKNNQNLHITYQSIKHVIPTKEIIAKKTKDHFYQSIQHAEHSIETIFQLHKRYMKLIHENFNNELCFRICIDQICGEYLIENSVVELGDSKTKLIDPVVDYYNELLKQTHGSVEDIACEEKLNQILVLFYNQGCESRGREETLTFALNPKLCDYFIRNFYQKLFSKRSMDQFDSFETDDKSVIDPQLKKILHFYAHQWEKYRISTQKETNANDVYELFPITINIWRKVLFKPLHEQITQACLQLINSERNKQVIPTHLIGAVIQSYVALNSASSTFKVLKNSFGTQFLAETQKFYRLEAINFLIDHSVTEYLKKVVARFDEEEQRVQSYLHPSLLQPLIENLENILIRNRLYLIYDEAKILLRNERYHDLALLFKLISRIPDAANELKEIVRNHISEIGVNSIKNISKTTIIDPKVYIDTIVDVHHKYFKVVLDVFNNDPKFLVSFHQACGHFINQNEVIQITGILVRYCDLWLKKGNTTEDEIDLDKKMNEIMIVFNYIQDKDVFLSFYKRTLRKRLLGQLSISEDHEKMLISKLKDTCGYEYTVELERMYQDFCISQTITDEYRNDCERKESILKESLREKCSVGFSVMVLSSNIWPLSDSTNLLLPIELKTTFDQFNEFYTNRHSNRKLTWIHQQSKGELEIYFHPKIYILQVSLYQMTILLLLNHNSSYWTVEKLYDATLINSDILKQTLCNLLKNKILICENITNEQVEDLDETNIEMNYSIKLADQFYNKKFKLNLNIPRKSNEQKSIQDVHTHIDVDREMNVQATIIRIMKTRQTLKYSLLIQEVLSQKVSYFKPEIPIIEKCIAVLIAKDYLVRSSKEKDVLHYLA